MLNAAIAFEQSLKPWGYAVQGVVQRVVLTGIVAGAGVGAAVGTLILPVIGTVIGAMYGAVAGAVFGFANVPGLCLLATRERRPRAARLRAAAVSSLVAAVVMALIVRDFGAGGLPVAGVFVALCALVGAAAGPYAAYGRPARRGRREPANLAVDCDRLGHAFGRGAAVCSAFGAIAGLVAGATVDPETVWVAAMVLAGLSSLVGGAIGLGLALLTERAVAGRVLGVGILLGSLIGGVAGTLRLPLYGTTAAAIAGALTGAALAATGAVLGTLVMHCGRHVRRS